MFTRRKDGIDAGEYSKSVISEQVKRRNGWTAERLYSQTILF